MNKLTKLTLIPFAFIAMMATTNSCAAQTKEIALITDCGDINDGSFNQESWEAVKWYGEKYHRSFNYYRPFADSQFSRICAVKQAVAKGAKIVVLPGYKFAGCCAVVSNQYPDVHFLLIDTFLHSGDYNPLGARDNVCAVGFHCELSGYIAGYAIATDLMTRDYKEDGALRSTYGYGYVGGMPSSGVYEFGFGYIQGICAASSKFVNDLKSQSVECSWPQLNFNYDYSYVFAQDDATTIKVKQWLADSNRDIKVVFPCGGKLYQSITEASQYYNKHTDSIPYDDWLGGKLDSSPREAVRWVGVDSDQSAGFRDGTFEKTSIYTSALKGLKATVIDTLDYHYNRHPEGVSNISWENIGGDHTGCDCFVPGIYEWQLGINSQFGDLDDPWANNDYVGIPIPTDDEGEWILDGRVLDGFSYYTINEYNDELYEWLKNGTLSVYSADGTEFDEYKSIHKGEGAGGWPENMDEWEWDDESQAHHTFKNDYLGNYGGNEDKIDIKVG